MPGTWEGDILAFTTQASLVVDDFESYGNISPDRPFQTWIDGFGYTNPAPGNPGNNTGAGMGHDIWSADSPYYDGDIMEQDSVNGGVQSAPIYYGSGDKTVSEVDRTFTPSQDWTRMGIETLVVNYQGFPDPLVQDPNGAMRLSAAGDNMMANNVTDDGCRFAYKQLNGDGSIIARLERHPYVNDWSKAGVMIRETMHPGSPGVSLYGTGTHGVRIGARTLAFAAASHTGGSTAMANQETPVWLKLQRTGNNIDAFYTPDPATQDWIPVESNPTVVPMGTNVLIGLALTSREMTQPVTAVFTDVSTVAGPWLIEDVGDTQPVNTPAQLYVAIEDMAGQRAVVNHEDGVRSVLQGQWTPWRIPLSGFTGVDLSQVRTLTIGINNTESSGPGLLLIDDIELQPQVDGQDS